MIYKVSTTGLQDPVILDDLGARSLSHPTVELDLGLEYTEDELKNSEDLQAAIDNDWLDVVESVGEDFEKTEENLYTISTSNPNYINALTITVSGIPTGDYRLGWSFSCKMGTANSTFGYRVRLDDTTDIVEDEVGISLDVTNWYKIYDYSILENLADGTHSFTLDFKSSASDVSASIKDSRFEFRRTS